MELETAARRVDEVGATLAEVARSLGSAYAPASAFGAAGSGALGELGRALAGQSSAAVAARMAEATAIANAASALAATVTGATSAYRAVDARRAGIARVDGA